MREIEYITIDSTSSEARRRLLSGELLPFRIVSAEQSAGRGTNGRQWASQPGNLYISWAYSLPKKAADPKRLMFSLAESVCASLQRYSSDISVKRPNDLHANELKLCGILCEPIGDYRAARCEWVIGLGLNINAEIESFPDELRDSVTCLRALKGKELDFEEVKHLVCAAVEGHIQRCIYK